MGEHSTGGFAAVFSLFRSGLRDFLTRGANACTEPASALCSSGGHDACGRSHSSPWEMEVNCLARADGAGRGRCLLAGRRGERSRGVITTCMVSIGFGEA